MYNFLHGVRVIELGHIVNGPLAGQLFGDFGADVIKVEALDGDVYRHAGISRNEAMGAQWQAVNRNKRAIAIDLKAPAGKQIFRKLLTGADAMIHNMRASAVARLGFDYASVRAIKPDIVYGFSAGYGQAGPYRDYPAFDDLIQGYSGLAASNTDADGAPRLVPLVIADTLTGQMLAQSVLAGLFSRQHTGQGCCVEVPMFEVATAMVLGQHLHGQAFRPPLAGYGYPRVLSANRGPCKTADGYIVHGVYRRKHWLAFLAAIERTELLASPMLATDADVAANIDELYTIMATQILPARNTDAWRTLFDSLDIPCAPVLQLSDLDQDEHLRAVGLFEDFDHPTEGPMRQTRLPIDVSGVAKEPDQPPPQLGQHSRQVLVDLGYDEAQISQFLDQRIILA